VKQLGLKSIALIDDRGPAIGHNMERRRDSPRRRFIFPSGSRAMFKDKREVQDCLGDQQYIATDESRRCCFGRTAQ
jgi:hypothetical protein